MKRSGLILGGRCVRGEFVFVNQAAEQIAASEAIEVDQQRQREPQVRLSLLLECVPPPHSNLAAASRFGEHAFVTSQGHPYAVFRRAIERRNLVAAWAAASELQTLSPPDALAVCLPVLDREPARFPRFALRWHTRLCAETATVGLDEGRLVLDLLSSLAGPEPRPAARALRELLASRDQKLAEPLRAWEAFAQVQRQPRTPTPQAAD